MNIIEDHTFLFSNDLFFIGQLTNNEVRFANISRGLHSYTVVARDDDGLVDRSEIHFEGEKEGWSSR